MLVNYESPFIFVNFEGSCHKYEIKAMCVQNVCVKVLVKKCILLSQSVFSQNDNCNLHDELKANKFAVCVNCEIKCKNKQNLLNCVLGFIFPDYFLLVTSHCFSI